MVRRRILGGPNGFINWNENMLQLSMNWLWCLEVCSWLLCANRAHSLSLLSKIFPFIISCNESCQTILVDHGRPRGRLQPWYLSSEMWSWPWSLTTLILRQIWEEDFLHVEMPQHFYSFFRIYWFFEKWQKMIFLQQNDRRQKMIFLQIFWELL